MHINKKTALSLPTFAALAFSASALAGTYPDYGFKPPKSAYPGDLFVLSQDYPQTPSPAASLPAFFKQLPASPLSNDFETWRAYMDAVKDYCLEGNRENNWRVQENKTRSWYHMPWQHYGPQGREGINGLTKEAKIQSKQLASTQTDIGQTYAVGIYNDIGAYTIGQVWKDPHNPDPSYTSSPNSFADGTVVCKALFADVNRQQVPFLTNALLWQGYVTENYTSQNRVVKDVALIQMDIAVRDSRISETGWLFGTFQYNGALNKADKWDNLVPVGIMWGNDPEVIDNDYNNPQPTQTRINSALKQTAINADSKALPPTHLGWNGRLNGPVDNPISSCMSCHMTGEYPQTAKLNPTFGDKPWPKEGKEEWMKWFANIGAGVSFTKGNQSTDYSLQLSGGLANFYDWKCNQGGVFTDGGNACSAAKAFKLRLGAPQALEQVQPVVRDPSLIELQ